MTINDIIKDFNYFDYKHNNYDVLSDFFIILADSISNSYESNFETFNKRENEYKRIIQKYNANDMEQFAKIASKIIKLYENDDIEDYLGEIFMKSGTQNSGAKGQIFTPYALSKICAEGIIDKSNLDKQILKIYEPASGGGGMLIALIDILKNKYNIDYKNKLLITACDIDRRCVCMTYIALNLLGVPAIIEEKNSLSGECWDRFETFAYKTNFKFKE